MSSVKTRFSGFGQAVREKAGNDAAAGEPRPSSSGAGVHKPGAALAGIVNSVNERVTEVERRLAEAGAENDDLKAELSRLRALQAAHPEEDGRRLLFLTPDRVVDLLPRDRSDAAFAGQQFQDLLDDVATHGQNDAITVRAAPDGMFEIAAGRRRLEVCRRLGCEVLARVRDLDDGAMLRIQYSENERRADVSPVDRARWFASVRERVKGTSKQLAAQFGIDPSTLSLYFRLARFPSEVLERLVDPGKLSMLPARRIMEAYESDKPAVMARMLAALDGLSKAHGADVDAAAQVDAILRAAENKGGQKPKASPSPERRHVVHGHRRIGTLNRNGRHWIFRFATDVSDDEVQALTTRLEALTDSAEVAANVVSDGTEPKQRGTEKEGRAA